MTRTVLFALLTLAAADRLAGADEAARGLKPLTIVDEAGGTVTFKEHHALVIGNSAYIGGWDPLKGVADDVTAVAAALERQGFDVQVARNLTKAQIEDTLDVFIEEKAGREDSRVVVYYAGHGYTAGKIGYLVGVDAPKPSEKGFVRKAYEIQAIKIKAQQARSRHVLFAFDSCFSGTVFTPLRGAHDYLLSAAREPVRMFLTSGSADEQVPDQSFFRQEFVRGIGGAADANHDGYVTGSELATYLKQTVQDRAGAAGMKLTPQAGVSEQEGFNRGDFVFKVGEAPAAAPPPVQPAPVANPSARRGEVYARAEAADPGDALAQLTAWQAVIDVLPPADDRTARDDQMAARAAAAVAASAPKAAVQERAQLVAQARRLSQDSEATRRAKREAWERVVAAWNAPRIPLTEAERAQIPELVPLAQSAGCTWPAAGIPAPTPAPAPAIVNAAPAPVVTTSSTVGPAWSSAHGDGPDGTRWADLAFKGQTMRFWYVPADGAVAALWVAEDECTQAFYNAVLGQSPSNFHGQRLGSNWSLSGTSSNQQVPDPPRCPVEQVAYADVMRFMAAVPTAKLRLPTEPEWRRFASDALARSRWEDPKASNFTRGPWNTGVATPDRFGLRDVIGNVWELLDTPGTMKRIAGAGFLDRPDKIRTSELVRQWSDKQSDRDVGFRCVIDAP